MARQALLVLACALGACGGVTVNDVALSTDDRTAIEAAYRVRIADGDYWYDRTSGLWGVRGSGVRGVIVAELALGGGALRGDASGGDTGVFVNGRELPRSDLSALEGLVGGVAPGRYWLDANGWAGLEGGPALVNLYAAAQSGGGGGGAGGGGGGEAWLRNTAGGGIGGQGDCFYFIDASSSYTGGGC
jgi:hypothetical protein